MLSLQVLVAKRPPSSTDRFIIIYLKMDAKLGIKYCSLDSRLCIICNHDIYYNPDTKYSIPLKRGHFDEDALRYIRKEIRQGGKM